MFDDERVKDLFKIVLSSSYKIDPVFKNNITTITYSICS